MVDRVELRKFIGRGLAVSGVLILSACAPVDHRGKAVEVERMVRINITPEPGIQGDYIKGIGFSIERAKTFRDYKIAERFDVESSFVVTGKGEPLDRGMEYLARRCRVLEKEGFYTGGGGRGSQSTARTMVQVEDARCVPELAQPQLAQR